MKMRISVHICTGLLALNLLALFAWTGSPAWGAPGSPDPNGLPTSFDAIASLMLQPLEGCEASLGTSPIMADLTGPTMLKVSLPGKVREIPVEFRSLRMMGAGSPDPSTVMLMLDPARMSAGKIVSPFDRPSTDRSFFDVFLELRMSDMSGEMLKLLSMDPIHLVAMTDVSLLIETRFMFMADMPGMSRTGQQAMTFYVPPSSGPIDRGTPCVALTRMNYVPVNPSAAIIKRELIQLEQKLDRLLKLTEPTPPPCDGPCP